MGVGRVLVEGLMTGFATHREIVEAPREIEVARRRLGESPTHELRRQLLDFGAVGRLAMAGKAEVVPLKEDGPPGRGQPRQA